MYNNSMPVVSSSMQLEYLIALQRQMYSLHGLPMPPVEVSDEEEQPPEEEVDNKEQRTIFVANLDERVDEEILYELFLQAGPLESVRIPNQGSYGFVTFVHECSAPYAMHLFKGLTLYGKTVTLKYKKSTNLPPLIHEKILPPDWGQMPPPASTSSRSYDNSALRRPNFSGFNNTTSGDRDLMPRTKNDWMTGPERNHRHRHHDNAKPYQRHSGGDSHDRRGSGGDRGYHNNDYQRRYAHSGDNRRAEQRNHRRS